EGVEGGLPAGAPSLLASTRRVEASDGAGQALDRCLRAREVTASTHAAAHPCVHALDRVRRIDDLTDLGVVGQKRNELRPRVLPQADDRGVALAPFAGELVEALPRGLLGRCGVDGTEIAGELVPVLLARVAKRVSHEM